MLLCCLMFALAGPITSPDQSRHFAAIFCYHWHRSWANKPPVSSSNVDRQASLACCWTAHGGRFAAISSRDQRKWASDQPCFVPEESTDQRFGLRCDSAVAEAKYNSEPVVYWIQWFRWWRCEAFVWSSCRNWRCIVESEALKHFERVQTRYQDMSRPEVKLWSCRYLQFEETLLSYYPGKRPQTVCWTGPMWKPNYLNQALHCYKIFVSGSSRTTCARFVSLPPSLPLAMYLSLSLFLFIYSYIFTYIHCTHPRNFETVFYSLKHIAVYVAPGIFARWCPWACWLSPLQTRRRCCASCGRVDQVQQNHCGYMAWWNKTFL